MSTEKKEKSSDFAVTTRTEFAKLVRYTRNMTQHTLKLATKNCKEGESWQMYQIEVADGTRYPISVMLSDLFRLIDESGKHKLGPSRVASKKVVRVSGQALDVLDQAVKLINAFIEYNQLEDTMNEGPNKYLLDLVDKMDAELDNDSNSLLLPKDAISEILKLYFAFWNAVKDTSNDKKFIVRNKSKDEMTPLEKRISGITTSLRYYAVEMLTGKSIIDIKTNRANGDLMLDFIYRQSFSSLLNQQYGIKEAKNANPDASWLKLITNIKQTAGKNMFGTSNKELKHETTLDRVMDTLEGSRKAVSAIGEDLAEDILKSYDNYRRMSDDEILEEVGPVQSAKKVKLEV